MALGPLTPIDRATLAYVAVALAFQLAAGPRTRPAVVLLPLGLLLVALVAAVLAPRARRAGPLGRFLGEFYPLVLVFGLYTHVGLVNVARGVSHDVLVQEWERALFGGHPSLEWIRAFPSPAWSALMHGAYLSSTVCCRRPRPGAPPSRRRTWRSPSWPRSAPGAASVPLAPCWFPPPC